MSKAASVSLIAAYLLVVAGPSWGQEIISLPVPSGPHTVGRDVLHWVDSSRWEPATEVGNDRREIVVQIWYPAAKKGDNAAPYMPGIEHVRTSAGAGDLRNVFGPSWPSIAAGKVRTNSFEKVPPISGPRLPVLIFCPGGGIPVVSYTIQMEELASHGYVVIGVDHTYDSPAVAFPDGRVVQSANSFWDRMRREIRNSESFERKVSEIQAADLRFVIDKVRDLESDNKSIFASKLDLSRIGVFGHSRGGRTAARVCQLDTRAKACLNQDGNWAWQPFWLDRSGDRLKQPFMMLDHLDPELPDEVFSKMGTTREEYVRRRLARQLEAREKLYSAVSGGSYHVTIRTPGISHNSFSDIRQLGRPDAGSINAWPRDVQAATPHHRILGIVSAFTRAFFDKHVRGISTALTDVHRALAADVEFREYALRRE